MWEALMAEHAVSIKKECIKLYMACINTDDGCIVLMVFLQKCITVKEIVFILFFLHLKVYSKLYYSINIITVPFIMGKTKWHSERHILML